MEAKETKSERAGKPRRPPYGVTLRALEREWERNDHGPKKHYKPTEEELTLVRNAMVRLRKESIKWIRSTSCMGQFSKRLGVYSWRTNQENPSLVGALHKAAWPSHIPLGLTNPHKAFHQEWMALKTWAESELLEVSLRVEHDALVHAYELFLDVKPSPRVRLQEDA